MKSCEEYREMINCYIDRELSRAERMEVEAHVEECAACARYLRQLERVFGSDFAPMPYSVAGRVLETIHNDIESADDPFAGPEKLKKQQKKREWSKNAKTWAAIAAVCLLALSTGIGKYVIDNFGATSAAPETPTAMGDTEVDAALSSAASAAVETVEEFAEEEEKHYEYSLSALPSAAFIEAVRAAESVTLRIGTDSAVISGDELEDFAARLGELPCANDEKLTGARIGSVELSPAPSFEVGITDAYAFVYSDSDAPVTITVGRDAFFDMMDSYR